VFHSRQKPQGSRQKAQSSLFSWKNGLPLLFYWEGGEILDKEDQKEIAPSSPQTEEIQPPAAPPPPVEETIVLGKLFPDVKQDLDSLFPDPQMKKLLKDIHRNQENNSRFLKRLHVDDPSADPEDPSPGVS
jgi:hypothetical protein